MSRPEFLFILALIILSASVGLALAEDELVSFEICASEDEHVRDRQEIIVRKSFIAVLRPAKVAGKDCTLMGARNGKRVFVYGTLKEVKRKLKISD